MPSPFPTTILPRHNPFPLAVPSSHSNALLSLLFLSHQFPSHIHNPLHSITNTYSQYITHNRNAANNPHPPQAPHACHTTTRITHSPFSSASLKINIPNTTSKCSFCKFLTAAKKEQADLGATLYVFAFDEEKTKLAALTKKVNDLSAEAQRADDEFAGFDYKVYKDLLTAKNRYGLLVWLTGQRWVFMENN